jgi:hypothetical protein
MAGAHSALGRRRAILGSLALAVLSAAISGCGTAVAPPLPDAEARIARLFHLYQAYVAKNQKGPPNEEALREFGKKLGTKEREDYATGDDFDTIFTSPRDNQKFAVKYGIKLDPAVTRAIIWESSSKDGMRYVALSNGYVVQNDDETLKQYQK